MNHLSLAEFADRVAELMPVIMREFVRQQAAQFYKLKTTMPQFFVLEILSRAGEMKMSDIAGYLNVSTAAITGMVDRLVRDRYVIRSRDDEDRRIVKIKLTTTGAKTVRDVIEKRKEITAKMFSVVTPEDRDQYLRILTVIRDKMKAEEGAG